VPPRPDANDVGSDDTAIRSFTFAPRTRRTGDETTTILSRSGSTARGRHAPSGPDQIDDYDEDEEESRPIGERARWALAIGVIAAVVVLGLAIGYAVLGLGDGRGTAPSARRDRPARSARRRPPAPPRCRRSTARADQRHDAGGRAGQAMDSKRTWKETLTQRVPPRTRRSRRASAAMPIRVSPSRSRRSCGC
jgi:hypothetical protein